MNERTKSRLWQLAVLAGAGAVAGLAYMPFIADTPSVKEAVDFAIQGVLITSFIFGFEIFVAQGPASESLRRAPFAVALFAKALVTMALIILAYGIGGVFLFEDRFMGEAPVGDLVRDTAFALGIAITLQFVLMVRSVVGGRVLANIVLGRYHRPLAEQRIFMFLDVSGSTGLAERLGGVGAYAMISRFFFDVAQETARFGGETHEYIGDEVVVTWPLSGPADNARCLDCYFAICDRIEAKAAHYERDFGQVPGFRVGLHGGPIVAGECGDDKREIVYFGDTINTAARIQEACKDFDRRLLISDELLARIDLSPGYAAVPFGPIGLRGREKKIALSTVERGASTPSHG